MGEISGFHFFGSDCGISDADIIILDRVGIHDIRCGRGSAGRTENCTHLVAACELTYIIYVFYIICAGAECTHNTTDGCCASNSACIIAVGDFRVFAGDIPGDASCIGTCAVDLAIVRTFIDGCSVEISGNTTDILLA